MEEPQNFACIGSKGSQGGHNVVMTKNAFSALLLAVIGAVIGLGAVVFSSTAGRVLLLVICTICIVGAGVMLSKDRELSRGR